MPKTALAAQRKGDKPDADDEDKEDNKDTCPVCRSRVRSTPGLRFKVNPKCYHRICEGCVDRHFASGKATCPVARCKQEVWKRDWRVPTFEDLQIEREVDIRKRVMAILNRREEEFESKRDWDDFLEQREELIMNLALGTDIAATNRKLKQYEEANAASIKVNAALDRQGADLSSDKADNVSHSVPPGLTADASGLVRGLRKITAPPPKVAYDPFMGMARSRDYYKVREDYPSRRLAKAKVDARTLAGGFDFIQFYDESLLRAFAGLSCFIEDEMAVRDQEVQEDIVAGGKGNDDVF